MSTRHPSAYTPKHLADRILANRSTMEGERKQVTVLFADVQGSMELAGQVDAETWHTLLDRFFAILTEGVHRFEGTVNQYTGDGIMALFGAPLAMEDHAQRACYAALHLRDALRGYAQELRRTRGLDFRTRIGLNSGEVVVGRIGDDLRMDYTAQGAVVGLAQRMEALAEAGRIYVAPATVQQVEGYFRFEALGEFQLKGLQQPVPVHALESTTALRSRFERSRLRGLTQFVGRDAELDFLESGLERAARGESVRLGVMGDAGVGKSRLCYEFAERARARGMTVLSVACAPFARMLPVHFLLALLRAWFDIAEQEAPGRAREKIAGRMVQLDATLLEDVPFACDFLGVPDPDRPVPPMQAEDRLQRIVQVIRRLRAAEAARDEGSLWVLEDLHWCDSASEAVLAAALRGQAGRSLVICNYRPEYNPPWRDDRDFQELVLTPLSAERVDALLDALLGGSVSARLRERIAARAAGNPFFAEEIVRHLVESAVLAGRAGAYEEARLTEAVAIPDSVLTVLAARIDRLDGDAKSALWAASILGQQLTLSLLAAVLDQTTDATLPTLQHLLDAGLLREIAIHPEPEYGFVHPLTREVAEQTVLSSRRQRIHLAAAVALESLQRANPGPQASRIAGHYEAGGDPASALTWMRHAAQWMESRDVEASEKLWRRVIMLLDRLSDQTPAWRRAVVAALNEVLRLCMQIPDREIGDLELLYARGLALNAGLDDPAAEFALESGIFYARMLRNDLLTAGTVLEPALRLADTHLSLPEQRTARMMHMNYFALVGPLRVSAQWAEAANRLGEEGVQEFRAHWDVGQTWSKARQISSLACAGPIGGAFAGLRALLATRGAHDSGFMRSGLVANYYELTELSGDSPDLALWLAEAFQLAEHATNPAARLQSLGVAGFLLRSQGRIDAARACLLPVTRGNVTGTIGWQRMQVLHLVLDADPDRMRAGFETLIERVAATPNARSEIEFRLKAMQTLDRHADAWPSSWFDRCDALVAQLGAKTLAPLVVEQRGLRCLREGNPDAAGQHFRQALAGCIEVGAGGHARRLRDRIGSTADTANAPDE
jgi:class 3 adenylate cyclase